MQLNYLQLHSKREESDFINVLKHQWMQLPCYYCYWNAACPKGAWPDKPDAILTQKCRKFHHRFQCQLDLQHYKLNLRVFSMALLPLFQLPDSVAVYDALHSKPNYNLKRVHVKWEEKKLNLMTAINCVWCI